eukprot:TRINITY_DN121647_c1_g1_i1.p1 TRINITY_DN121647_c1_g1~~TRINITY_DN121647_c1_g1_i1.p1  ORF type:complete len:510 (-),score=50.90 TRINITY_DN121647_c1_g1_i1:129-1658(-)
MRTLEIIMLSVRSYQAMQFLLQTVHIISLIIVIVLSKMMHTVNLFRKSKQLQIILIHLISKMSVEPYYRTGLSTIHREFMSPASIYRKPTIPVEHRETESQFNTLQRMPYVTVSYGQLQSYVQPESFDSDPKRFSQVNYHKFKHQFSAVTFFPFHTQNAERSVESPSAVDIKPSENGRKIVIATGQSEYEVPDPTMYVTKVINPEKEIKKRLMAKELESALQEQIANKRRAKEEEKKNRIIEELREEEKWLREREEADRQKLPKAKAEVLQLEEAPAEPQLPSSPPTQPAPELPKKPPQYIHKLEIQLKQIRNEMMEKEKEFHSELEKLKLVANESNNAREAADKQLTQLKDHIVKRPEFSQSLMPSFMVKESARYYGTKHEKNYGVGKYSKLYFTDYNKALSASSRVFNKDEFLAKGRYRNKFASENFLPGESQMVPWKPFEESPHSRVKSRTMQDFGQGTGGKSASIAFGKGRGQIKSTYDKLDDLMKEFLSHKSREDRGKDYNNAF